MPFPIIKGSSFEPFFTILPLLTIPIPLHNYISNEIQLEIQLELDLLVYQFYTKNAVLTKYDIFILKSSLNTNQVIKSVV